MINELDCYLFTQDPSQHHINHNFSNPFICVCLVDFNHKQTSDFNNKFCQQETYLTLNTVSRKAHNALTPPSVEGWLAV